MLELLEFLSTIKPDCTGYGSALVRTIEANTGLTREEIHRMAVEAEHDGLVETIRLSLSGAEGLLAVRLSPKGREWLKVCGTDSWNVGFFLVLFRIVRV